MEFSIIIPARNEERFIGACLDTLIAQDYTKPFEIIVVDGLSEDATVRIVKSYMKQYKFVYLLFNPQKVTPVAFNVGVRSARGKHLLTVGAHWKLPANFLKMIEGTFISHPEVDCLGGRVVRIIETETGRAIEAARASLLGGGLADRNVLEVEQIVKSPNVAYIWRRRVFDIIGDFDERLVKNQDNEFNLRSLRAGMLTLYAPQILFYYRVPDTFYKLYKQMYSYTSYIPVIQLKYRKLLYASYSLPFIGLLVLLNLLALSIIGTISIGIPLSLLVVYFIVTLTFALRVGFLVGSLSCWWKVCVAFWTIHIATSMGMLNGLLRLLNPQLTFGLWHDYKRLPRPNLEGKI